LNCNVIPDCEQYANDMEILAQFPFYVTLDYKKQGPGISMAILDETGTSVSMIQLKEAGAIVPDSVFCLKNLGSLSVENMRFVDDIVPDALANLQKLFHLSFLKMPISKITDKLNTLQGLQSITIDNCSLSDMPSLSGMYKLYSVSLPNNRLSKLEGLTNVSSLHLYKNQFTQIPTSELPGNLRMLNMNYNPVENMDIITTYVNMTDLRLSQTKIPSIPEGISELQYLSFLDVSFGQLTNVPETISKIPKLQFLVIYGNKITDEVVGAIKANFSSNRPTVNLLI
jgi:internalin A